VSISLSRLFHQPSRAETPQPQNCITLKRETDLLVPPASEVGLRRVGPERLAEPLVGLEHLARHREGDILVNELLGVGAAGLGTRDDGAAGKKEKRKRKKSNITVSASHSNSKQTYLNQTTAE
jgi:hypothetical protein